jgi:hypothetical protein
MSIDDDRLAIITQLNRSSYTYPKLKKEAFYYNEDLKCWTIRRNRFKKINKEKEKSNG